MTDERDPIAELLAALDTSGKPPLQWVVRWSTDGREPLAAAWDASADPAALIGVIARARNEPESVAIDAVFAVSRWKLGFEWDVSPDDGRTRLRYCGAAARRACDAIRARWTAPTLDALLVAHRAR